MLFNVKKCKCHHLGHNYPDTEYFVGNEKIELVIEEKDLGVIIHKSLSPSRHIGSIVKKANQLLGMIGRTY